MVGGASSLIMEFWWLLPVLGLAAIALYVVARRRRGSRATFAAEGTPVLNVAHTDQLAALEPYQRWLRMYRYLRRALLVTIVVGICGAIFLSGRLSDTRTHSPELATRDIVLCLDVSGSMTAYDTEIVQRFADMVKNFDGERIALTIFNSTSRVVLPLTDDYQLIEDQLSQAASALDFDFEGYVTGSKNYSDEKIDELLNFVEGTQGIEDQASLIGDGLASCALQFDEQNTDRSRSIILATDNQVNGEPIYTLPEAAQLVSDRHITLYGLYAMGSQSDYSDSELAAQKKEYEDTITGIGGKVYENDDPDATAGIVDDIAQQQAVALDATPEVTKTDQPLAGFVIAYLALVGLILAAWRLQP